MAAGAARGMTGLSRHAGSRSLPASPLPSSSPRPVPAARAVSAVPAPLAGPPAPARFGAGGKGRRMAVLAISILAHLLIGAGLIVQWSARYRRVEPPTLTTIAIAPPAVPPDPAAATPPDKPRPAAPPRSPRPAPVPPPRIAVPSLNSLPVLPLQPVTENVPETPPPPPPAPSPATASRPTWEGQVLERLGRFRRYPREAHAARRQGVPWIRFTMDREGRVLSSRLDRASGVASLDREAVSLPRRAQPLPRPPEDVAGDIIVLVVPVEFFLR
ncbi:MAG: energy transducer TonB [Sphingobium sp.]